MVDIWPVECWGNCLRNVETSRHGPVFGVGVGPCRQLLGTGSGTAVQVELQMGGGAQLVQVGFIG